jgi:hypothetical protein
MSTGPRQATLTELSRQVDRLGELSAAPGAGGKPIHEWLEVRPFLAAPRTITE